MKLTSRRLLLVSALFVLLYASLTGCSYFVSDLPRLAPKPEITMKTPPRIVNAEAPFKETSRYDHYETMCDTCCDWICYWWGCQWECWTCCWSEWRYTDIKGYLDMKLDVEDLFDDLPDNSPSIMIRTVSAGTPCEPAIDKEEQLTSADISGTGVNKVVRKKVTGISVRFTPQCSRTISVECLLRLKIIDGDWVGWSNEKSVTLTVKR